MSNRYYDSYIFAEGCVLSAAQEHCVEFQIFEQAMAKFLPEEIHALAQEVLKNILQKATEFYPET